MTLFKALSPQLKIDYHLNAVPANVANCISIAYNSQSPHCHCVFTTHYFIYPHLDIMQTIFDLPKAKYGNSAHPSINKSREYLFLNQMKAINFQQQI